MKRTAFPIEDAVRNVERSAPAQRKPENFRIEVYQQDWMPGFAAFLNDGSVQKKAPVHIAINVGALVAAVATKDIQNKDVPYIVAESIMHEIIHSLEAWANVEFNEERVEALIQKYTQAAKGKNNRKRV